MSHPSAHVDSFCRDRLPASEHYPELLLSPDQVGLPLNAGTVLADRFAEGESSQRIALEGDHEQVTYAQLRERTDRLAGALVDQLGMVPGQRILIRSFNNPRHVELWLAATKAGLVVVNTMPMLRTPELRKVVEKAEIRVALCDVRLAAELESVRQESGPLERVVLFDAMSAKGELEVLAAAQSDRFTACATAADDVALLGFTSGTTGSPKATAHFHRDLLAIADGYARHALAPTVEDAFIGSPPLAFTFGLGAMAIFPLRFGARAILIEQPRPAALLQELRKRKATLVFSSPTGYRAMLEASANPEQDFASLRGAISAGETLPRAIHDEWFAATHKPILDGIGATELLHIFITNTFADHRPGTTGRPVPGYQVAVLDEDLKPVPAGTVGKLAVKGPTGCRYLDDERQAEYVRGGWNLTGDAFYEDEEGRFHFAARTDDMIVSSGYNIAAPEVEDALLLHAAVQQCAVVAKPDPDRGHIVQAHVVLNESFEAGSALVTELQDHVKATIAPYKYPRAIAFHPALPRTQTGKVQRFRLREA